jgi:hypothetical protein
MAISPQTSLFLIFICRTQINGYRTINRFITTARVSSQTRQEGLTDESRRISIIDGQSLIELCTKYEVGVKTDYRIGFSALKEEGIATPQMVEITEKFPQQILTETLQESFSLLKHH